MRQTFRVDTANAGRRFDKLVRQLCPQWPLAALMRLIRLGQVRLNGHKAPAAQRVGLDDDILLPSSQPAVVAARPAPRPALMQCAILYEDDALLVLNKPAGLACHPGTSHPTASLIQQVTDYLRQQLAGAVLPPGQQPGLAQRLDLGVSGLVVVGKNTPVLRALSRQVEKNQVRKVYTAWVHGQVQAAHGVVDAPLRVLDQPQGDRPKTIVDAQGKPAHTTYQVVARGRHATRLMLTLATGRTHQIRAHMRHLGHPILGDARYGLAAVNRHFYETYGLRWPCLHAAEIFLPHPQTSQALHFVAPLPTMWQTMASGL